MDVDKRPNCVGVSCKILSLSYKHFSTRCTTIFFTYLPYTLLQFKNSTTHKTYLDSTGYSREAHMFTGANSNSNIKTSYKFTELNMFQQTLNLWLLQLNTWSDTKPLIHGQSWYSCCSWCHACSYAIIFTVNHWSSLLPWTLGISVSI